MVVDRPYHITKKSSLEFTKHFVLDISTLGLSPDFQMKFDFRAKIEKSPCRKWTDGIGSRSSYWTIIFQTQREKNHSWKSLMLSFWCFKHFAFMSAPSIYIQTFFHRTYVCVLPKAIQSNAMLKPNMLCYLFFESSFEWYIHFTKINQYWPTICIARPLHCVRFPIARWNTNGCVIIHFHRSNRIACLVNKLRFTIGHLFAICKWLDVLLPMKINASS